jgi:hypothetical protein
VKVRMKVGRKWNRTLNSDPLVKDGERGGSPSQTRANTRGPFLNKILSWLYAFILGQCSHVSSTMQTPTASPFQGSASNPTGLP